MEWIHFVKRDKYSESYMHTHLDLKVCTWNQWPRVRKSLEVQPEDCLLVLNEKMEFVRIASVDEKNCTYVLKSTSDLTHPALKKLMHAKDRVCIVALSFESNVKNESDWNRLYKEGQGLEYEEHMRCFRKFGIRDNQIEWVKYFSDSKEEILDKIEKSNVLMITGGDPVCMMKRMKELRLKSILKKYHGLIIGYSAGAMVLLDQYHMEDVYYTGIGCLSGFDIEVHYDGQKAERERMQRICNEKNKDVYGISDGGGIVISQGKMTFFGNVEYGRIDA